MWPARNFLQLLEKWLASELNSTFGQLVVEGKVHARALPGVVCQWSAASAVGFEIVSALSVQCAVLRLPGRLQGRLAYFSMLIPNMLVSSWSPQYFRKLQFEVQ